MKKRIPFFVSFIGIFIIGSIIAAIGTILTNTEKKASAVPFAAEGSSSYGMRYLAIGLAVAFIVTLLIRSRNKKR
ncbi:MAG: hypothetical protein ACM3ZR_02990 [Pseudomonadota bacterium]